MVIIMLGAPGTGKGTISSYLKKELGIPQVSTGDIFREQIKEKTEYGKLAESYMAKGALVPDEVTIKIIKSRLEEDDVEKGIILDGFPRNIKQAQELDKILKEKSKKVDLVVNLQTPEEEIIERIVNRRICSNQECKAIYNLVLNPPKQENVCDKCGHELIQRKDDNIETIKLRLESYFKETNPLVNYYEKEGNLYSTLVSKKVNKLGEDVAKEVVKYIKDNKIK